MVVVLRCGLIGRGTEAGGGDVTLAVEQWVEQCANILAAASARAPIVYSCACGSPRAGAKAFGVTAVTGGAVEDGMSR
jgi:hypothetical protein